ncbi:MAG: hypothetical protein QE278_12450 [Limnobacter sp.]|nr:hypothetical protein [Limnobacter sp.]
MKMTRQYVGSLLEKPAQGMGLFVLRRPNLLTEQIYSFELWLDGYQSHCLRQWLELRWKVPCLQNSRVLRDTSSGNSAIFRSQNAASEVDAKELFEAWIEKLTKAKASHVFDGN